MAAKLDSFSCIPAAFFSIADRLATEIVYERAIFGKEENGRRKWLATTYAESADRVKKLAAYLQSIGIQPGDAVAIISQSRAEWMEVDLAILSIGAITVSVYQSLPADDIAYILFDSGAKCVFVENQEQIDKIEWLQNNDVIIPAVEDRNEQKTRVKISNVICFEAATSLLEFVNLSEAMLVNTEFSEQAYSKLVQDDIASLVYTSGTTGPPKGVVQTHGNHLANCRQAWNAGLLHEKSSILIFLPLAHSFARLMGYLGFLSEGSLKFPSIPDSKSSKLHPDEMTRDIREANATIIPIVPRLLEKMQSGILQTSKGSSLTARLLALSLWGAKEIYSKKNERESNLGARIVYAGTSMIRKKVQRRLFGEAFEYSISGGAKLNTDTAYFFDMLGVEVLEGYGLTETAVATNVNRPGQKKIGTVGPVLDDDIEIKIENDGEISFRGPNVAKGYYGRPAATAESWDSDGWFHTGDLGSLDNEGYLSIVGRKKGILVSSYGKNIAPEEIEAAVKSIELVSQAVLVGDARPYCICLITLDVAAVTAWAKKIGISFDPEVAHKLPEVEKEVWQRVEEVNKTLAKHESMKKVIILPSDFTVENGLLTPTFKVKTKLVLNEYSDLIESAYS